MRSLLLSTLLALFLASPVNAATQRTAFLNLQEECVAIGDISLGAKGRWAHCAVTRGRWVATMELIDLYQAQYCLGSEANGRCDERALLIFGNVAYTPIADLLIQRIDPGDTEYEDPLVIITDYGRIMTIAAHSASGGTRNRYLRWQANNTWADIDAQAWLKDLSRRLPAGVSAREGGWPDVDTMSTVVRLFRKSDAQDSPSAGLATVEFGVAKNRFVIKKVTLAK